jgi:DNA repair exonuclease SbcCD nuclease subunit
LKILVVSDCHLHDWQDFSHDDCGVGSRLRNCISVWQLARAYCVKHGIKLALFCGDVVHKRGIIYTHAWNLLCEELAQWKKVGIMLLGNPGNHDMADRLGKIHVLQALQSAELILTVNDDGWANWVVESESGDAVEVTAVAYCSDAAELRRRTDAALVDRGHISVPSIGMFHHGFKGARVGTSLEYVVKEEADPDTYTKEFNLQLSGHYHAHQEIGSNGNAWYVGSPMEFVRGETSPKGFLVVDTENITKFKRVTLDLPRFVKLTHEQIVDDDFDIKAHVAGNFVDVVFDELPMTFEKLEDTLTRCGAEGVRACPTRSDKLVKSSRLNVDPAAGDKALLESYLEHVGVDPSERDELLKTGLELLEEGMR